MKHNLHILVLLFVAGSLLLSACSGSVIGASSWPGLTADGETAYLASASRIFAVNVKDGTLKWSYPDMTAKTKLQFFASPSLENGTVIAGDFGHSLYGLAKDTGLLQWQFDGAKNRWVASPLVIGDTIVAPNADRHIYGLDIRGVQKWVFATKESNWSQPATDGKLAFVPSMDHYVYALDAATGNLVWSVDAGGAIPSNAVYLQDSKAVVVGTLASELLALSAADGKELWRAKTDGSIWSYPVLYEGALYLGDYAGNAYKIDPATGEIAWKKPLGSIITGAPVATSEGVVFNTSAGLLTMLDAESNQGSRVETGVKLNSTPVLAGDKIIVPLTKDDILLEAYDLKGAKVWSFTLPK